MSSPETPITVAFIASYCGRRLGERIGLDRAALGECLGIEVEHDRALLQRLAEDEAEGLAGQRGVGLECRERDRRP